MRCTQLIAGLALLMAPLAAAQAPSSVFLEELTWTEVRDLVAAGRTTILVPIGGTEQNGPHMALGKHNARAKALAGRIAGALGDALVAPVIAYVPEGNVEPPTQHMRYPGTISIPESAFEQTLEAAARSFRRHGFTDVVFLGDHGGYRKSLAKAAERLNREWSKSGGRAHALPEYYEALGIREHAGLADTSLTLVTNPELVRRPIEVRPNSDGVQGDPRQASARLGRPALEAVVARTVEAIRKAKRPK